MPTKEAMTIIRESATFLDIKNILSTMSKRALICFIQLLRDYQHENKAAGSLITEIIQLAESELEKYKQEEATL
ncbi:hypothetical protein ACSMFR_05520 [Listeria aquatica]|uniref:hypothetical protein n=1 Tax=Listeria aquatica TaxID=1494960 RepID=UPI003EF63412